ncbi:MAG: DUF2851 family protein [Flavobacterium sp.]
MKEYFLHRLWQWGYYDTLRLTTTDNLPITVIHPGQYHQKQGPDFFNALLEIDGQKWAGTVEIHLKSSDWYLHHHETDGHYDNVILHVVWEHDMDVFRSDSQKIPVLELKHFVAEDTLHRYRKLMEPKSWIYCEEYLDSMDELTQRQWLDELFVERLKLKSEEVYSVLSHSGNDWEAVLFYTLAKSFGLQHNGEQFQKMVTAVTHQVFQKESEDLMHLEALLLGMAGLLSAEFQESYPKQLKAQWQFLQAKYQISDETTTPVTFYQVRPDNFPTIRLAQLAALYHNQFPLFQKILLTNDINELRRLFRVKTSAYWDTHYNFDKPIAPKSKGLTDSFKQLLIINSVIPVKFAYLRWQGIEDESKLMNWMEQLNPEENKIVSFFRNYKVNAANALDSQALIHLKKNYCDQKRCLDCRFGKKIMSP